MTLWTYTAREIRQRPGRALLTLLGIAIGVAVFVATAVTIRSAHQAYRDMFERVTGRSSLEIVAPGFAGFDGRFAAGFRSLPGVRAVVGRIQTAASLAGSADTMPALVYGIEPACPDAVEAFPLRAGRPLGQEEGVLLGAEAAAANGFRLGQAVRLWTPAGPVRLPLVGTLEPNGAAAFAGGAVVCMPLATAQRLFRLTGQVNSVEIVLGDRVQPRDVEPAIAARLPAGLTVQSPGTRGELAQATLLSMEQGLDCLSFVALVAAGFVTLNTFLLNLGERRRQLAILRVLGATRGQVLRLLLGEALLLGLTGTAAGLGAGLALALLLQQGVEQLMGLSLPGLSLTLEPFLLALVLGPGTALAATYFSARRASRRQPRDELLGRHATPGERLPRWAGVAGVLLLVVSSVLEAGLCRGWFSMPVTRILLAPGVALFLVGCVLALPLILSPLLAVSGWLLRPVLGVEGSLALRQLARHRTRTGLTVGVLFVAVAVAIAFGNSLLNIVRDLRHWYEQAVVGDFLVRGSMPDTGFLLPTALPETLARDIQKIENVAGVERISFVPARANGEQVLVLARTFPPTGPLPIDLQAGDPAAVSRGLARGEVVLGSVVARQLGVGCGDRLVLQTRHGPRRLRIAGTMTEYVAGGNVLYMNWKSGKHLFDLKGVHVFLVSARPGAVSTLAGSLRGFCGRHHLLLQSNEDLHAFIDHLLSRVVGVLWVLVAVVFVVASLGIVNTLTMNVFEQAREVAMLRAIGMTRGQVRKGIRAQAVLTSLASLAPGTLAGCGLAYFLNQASAAVLGQCVAFRLDLVLLGGCVGMALAIALAAALLPAARAARVKMIAYVTH
jgi:putative ABC transport system permease protein